MLHAPSRAGVVARADHGAFLGFQPRQRLQYRRCLHPDAASQDRPAVRPEHDTDDSRRRIPAEAVSRRMSVLRPPLRFRSTFASSAGMAVILITLSLFVYAPLRAELLRALDSGLQARASPIAGSLGLQGQRRPAI